MRRCGTCPAVTGCAVAARQSLAIVPHHQGWRRRAIIGRAAAPSRRYVRSHFDSIEMRVPDAPRPDEIVFIIAMACGGASLRMGGLAAEGITKFGRPALTTLSKRSHPFPEMTMQRRQFHAAVRQSRRSAGFF